MKANKRRCLTHMLRQYGEKKIYIQYFLSNKLCIIKKINQKNNNKKRNKYDYIHTRAYVSEKSWQKKISGKKNELAKFIRKQIRVNQVFVYSFGQLRLLRSELSPKTRVYLRIFFFSERSRFNIYSLLALRNDDDDTYRRVRNK